MSEKDARALEKAMGPHRPAVDGTDNSGAVCGESRETLAALSAAPTGGETGARERIVEAILGADTACKDSLADWHFAEACPECAGKIADAVLSALPGAAPRGDDGLRAAASGREDEAPNVALTDAEAKHLAELRQYIPGSIFLGIIDKYEGALRARSAPRSGGQAAGERTDWQNTGCPLCPRCGYPEAPVSEADQHFVNDLHDAKYRELNDTAGVRLSAYEFRRLCDLASSRAPSDRATANRQEG